MIASIEEHRVLIAAFIELTLLGPCADIWIAQGRGWAALLAAFLTTVQSIVLYFLVGHTDQGIEVGVAGYLIAAAWRVSWTLTGRRLEWKLLTILRVRRSVWRANPHLQAGTSAVLMAIGLMQGTSLGVLIGIVFVVIFNIIVGRSIRRSGPSMAWVATYLFAALLLGINDGRLLWVANGDQVTASVLALLIQVQLVLGVIPVSAALVVAQIASGWIGLRVLTRLSVRPSIVISFIILGCSIGLDVYLAGREQIDTRWTELAEVMAAVAILVAFISVLDAFRSLSIERVTATLVGQLDRDWLQYVVESVRFDGFETWRQGDPFHSYLTVLHKSAIRDGESDVFTNGTRELSERLHMLISQTEIRERPPILSELPAPQLALDTYLAQEMTPLIEQAAGRGFGWVLDAMVALRFNLEPWRRRGLDSRGRVIEPEGWSADDLLRGRQVDLPYGIRIYGAVVDGAIANGLDRQAEEGVIRCMSYMEQVVSCLPESTGVWGVDPNATVPDYALVGPGQALTTAIEGYLSAMRRWGAIAFDKKLAMTARSIVQAVGGITQSGWRTADELWAIWLVQGSASIATAISVDARAHRRFGYWLPIYLEGLDTYSPRCEKLLNIWIPRIVEVLRGSASLVGWHQSIEVGMFARHLVDRFPNHADLICSALEYVAENGMSDLSASERVDAERDLANRIQVIRRALTHREVEAEEVAASDGNSPPPA